MVIDADSKQPIANARVGMNWTQSRSVFTDDNGRYTLPGWTGGGVSDIHVSADGYGQDSAVVEKRDVVDFSLAKGDSARGRVIDQHGRPVAGARVSAIGSIHRGGRQTSSRRHAETDAGGRFLVRGLRRDLYHALVVMVPGFGRQLIDFGPVPGGPGTFEFGDITLTPGRSIEGVVRDGEGQPVPRVRVALTGANADRGRLKPAQIKQNMQYGERERRRTDDLGRFRFPDLSPGSYELTASRDGGAPAKLTVELSAGQNVLDAELSFAAGRTFVVTVVDPAGARVPGALMGVQHAHGGLNGRTDAEGRAEFTVSGAVRSVSVWGMLDQTQSDAYTSRDRVGDLVGPPPGLRAG